jgi:rSAM/selenodomain-associated transferase 2
VLSIIVPTLNEEKVIGGVLDHLFALPGDFEVIVSDGGSKDGTRREVSRRPRARWVEGPAGRARQLDRGARLARGGMLLFLHADTLLPAGALVTLNELEARGAAVAGGFPHRYASGGLLVRLASWIHSTRSRLTGVYYGDQAPFVSRCLYEELGGFGEVPVMEDLDFGRRLGRRTPMLRMPWPVLNSPRKLERRGVLRSGFDAIYALACYRVGRYQHLAKHAFFGEVR